MPHIARLHTTENNKGMRWLTHLPAADPVHFLGHAQGPAQSPQESATQSKSIVRATDSLIERPLRHLLAPMHSPSKATYRECNHRQSTACANVPGFAASSEPSGARQQNLLHKPKATHAKALQDARWQRLEPQTCEPMRRSACLGPNELHKAQGNAATNRSRLRTRTAIDSW